MGQALWGPVRFLGAGVRLTSGALRYLSFSLADDAPLSRFPTRHVLRRDLPMTARFGRLRFDCAVPRPTMVLWFSEGAGYFRPFPIPGALFGLLALAGPIGALVPFRFHRFGPLVGLGVLLRDARPRSMVAVSFRRPFLLTTRAC